MPVIKCSWYISEELFSQLVAYAKVFITSALVHTNHQTMPMCEHHCSCLVVRSIQQGHSFHGHYLLGHLRTSGCLRNPVPCSVRRGRRQDQALQSVILQAAAVAVQSVILHLQTAALVVVRCND